MLTLTEFGSHKHCTHKKKKKKKKLSTLKTNNFSWKHQRIQSTGQLTILKFGETGTYGKPELRSAYLKQKPLEAVASWNTLMVILNN